MCLPTGVLKQLFVRKNIHGTISKFIISDTKNKLGIKIAILNGHWSASVSQVQM